MSEVTLFNQERPAHLRANRGLSDLTRSLTGGGGGGGKRISIRGKMFRKIVGGEEVGKIKDELNVVIVNANRNVSRIFYAGKYEPDAVVPPTCWSTNGQVPDEAVEEKQSPNCATCANNVAGSSSSGGRACRYQRRIAIVLEGDPTGEVYQLTLPSMSIFGKGTGNIHPFDSYIKFLAGNNYNVEEVITKVIMDSDSDTPRLLFSPVRHVTEDELGLVQTAIDSPEAKAAVNMTVSQMDGVQAKPTLAAPKATPKPVVKAEEVEEEEISEPVKRAPKKAEPVVSAKEDITDVINAWTNED